jgi:hypothetical protein
MLNRILIIVFVQVAIGLFALSEMMASYIDGQRLYAKHCVVCHGENGSGQPDGYGLYYDDEGTLFSFFMGALRSDGTEKGTGFRGAHKMTDGSDRIVTDMTVEGGLIVNNRSIEYPLLVPTLNKAEVKILMRGGDIPTSIRKKAIDHAKMRIERGMSQFSNHAPDTQKKFELVESLGDCNDFTDKAFQYGITDEQIVEKIANETVHWLSDFRNELTEEEMHALIPIIRGFEE